MHAIISDIHGNLEALNAVLHRLRQLGADELVFLGDVVGYGPDSMACLRIAATWPNVVAGDWDRALVNHDPTQWSPWFNRHLEWLNRQLAMQPDGASLIATIESFRDMLRRNGCTYCHGTPGDPRDFVFPEDIHNPRKLDRIAQQFDRILFAGHTHILGAFVSPSESQWEYLEPASNHRIDISRFAKVICNVGSVGQPRDGDARASFVTFDGSVAQLHRVEYDFNTTINKIKAIPEIDDIQGLRLAEGR